MRSCSPSTFSVITVNCSVRRAISASESGHDCRGALVMRSRRQRYQRHKRTGSRRKFSMDAIFSGSERTIEFSFFSASVNAGIADSAASPSPMSTTTRRALSSAALISSMTASTEPPRHIEAPLQRGQ
jgi:hypothetical protein